MYKLKTPYQDIPVDSTITVRSTEAGFADVVYKSKVYMIPVGFIRRVKLKPASYSAIKPVNYQELALANNPQTAEQALRVVKLSCYCGAVQEKVSYGLKWEAEKHELDRVIRSCVQCTSHMAVSQASDQ